MKQAVFIIKIICAVLILSIGVVCLCNCISSYSNNPLYLDYHNGPLSLWEYIYENDMATEFFGSWLTIVVGIYIFFNSFSNLEPKKKLLSDDKTISTLSRYKSLLDSGIITQEEFDLKKQELLEL